ncbi:MAG: 8-oxoguanine deaminase, partial [Thermotogae bacterium]
IAHCPVSNMRLGSGIAPVFKMKNRVRVGIAVDGSASNDTNNMLQEIRTAMLLQRVKYGAGAMTPVEVLKMATSGGSSVLRMKRVGKIKEGMAADFIGFKMDRIEFAGALSDPIGAIVMCDAKSVDFSVVNGEFRIREGRILDDEIDYMIRRHNEISARLIGL